MGVVLALVLSVFVLIRIPAVQQYVLRQVTNYLEKKIETPFRIGGIGLELPKMLVLEDIYVEDRNQDTLLAGEKLRVDINMLKLFRNVVEIQRIDLIGVKARINRRLPEGTFNFAYILDAFTTSDNNPNVQEPDSAPADSTAPMVIDIDRINLERIAISYHDEVIGLSTQIGIGKLNTRIETFDLSGNMPFGAPRIEIDGLQGQLRQWTSEIPPDTTDGGPLPQIDLNLIDLKNIDFAYINDDMVLDSRFAFGELLVRLEKLDLNLMQAQIEQLSIAGGNINYQDGGQPRLSKGFDYGNIGISGLQGSLSDLYFSMDSISGELSGLTARDHSGFTLNQLSSNFIYTERGIELKDLYAETPNTRIKDYLSIQYPSLETLTENLEKIQIRADLQNSHLGMRDVLYFVPDLDTMQLLQPLLNQTIFVDGQVNGRLNNLHIPSLRISTLDQTIIHASADIRGLPDMDKLDLQLQLHIMASSRSDLEQLLPQGLLPDSIRLPEDLLLSGNFNGGLNGFVTDLELRTSDGFVSLAGTYDVTTNPGGTGPDTSYQAQVAIMDVDLGKILMQDSTLGKVSFAAAIQGTGLDPKKANASFQGELIGLEAMGYHYQHVLLTAEASSGIIEVNAGSDDPNMDFDLDAQANLLGEYPKLDLVLMIDSVNLKNLGLMEDEFRYHGQVIAHLETADLDFLNGMVEIRNSSIAYNQERYTFDSIKLLAKAEEGSNLLQLSSEFLNAHLVGDYKLSELNAAILDITAVYYQPDSVAQTYQYSPQQFDFSARLSRSKFVREFLPDLTEMKDITLDGSFNSEDKFLMVKALAPRLEYGGTTITDVGLDITTFDSTMYYSALIKQIGISNIELTNTLISGTVLQNHLDFGLWIKDKEDQERYHLGMGLQVDAGNFIFSLLENGLMLNYEQWEVNPENQIIFGKDGVRAKQFILSQNGQQMAMQSQDSTLNSPLNLSFDNFRIETFSKMLDSELLDMGGGINGRATISRLESNPIFVSDIRIDRFYFGNDTVGDVLINVNNERENIYATKIDIVGNGNEMSLTGEFIAPPGQDVRLDFVLDLHPLQMETVEAFSLGYLRQTRGNLTGRLAIKGTPSAPRINGELLFNDAGMNVGMINANFTVANQKILFDDQGIRFNRFEMRDSKNNIARLNGTINTTTYSDFNFNLTVNADDFQVLNSTKKDLDIFYGQLFISSNLRITGSLNNPMINGSLNVDEHTNVTFVLPNDDPGMVERDGIIKFVNRSDTARVNVFARLDSLTTTELGGLRLSLNIQTHESAAFSIVIDEGSGDALNIMGSADLTAGIDPSGNITLTGTYTVEEGNYSFTFEPVKRVFDFKKGSTITWAGDPMDARLNITAVYKVKAPTLELVQNQLGGQQANLYKQRVPFDVNLGITGQMLQPDLEFWIDLDEDNSLISQDVASKVNTALAQLKENESEMNKQVFSLIVMGKFMAANPFESVSGGSVGSMARNSVSSLLTAQLNKLAGDLIKGVDLDFDLQSGDDYSTGTVMSRTDLNIGVSKMLFDDRLKVTIGSNFELEGNARPGEQTTNIAGDIAIDYQLSRDGRYLLRVYRKNQYQVTLQGQYVETGIGFIINMDYNQFREVFQKSKETADEYSTDTRAFQRRFDRDRMETDSVYRDSVRQVIRDSIGREPGGRERLRNRQQNNNDSLRTPRQDTDRSVVQNFKWLSRIWEERRRVYA